MNTQELRAKSEDLASLFDVAVKEIEENDKRTGLLDERSRELYDFKGQLEVREMNIDKKLLEQQREKDYIAEKNKEIKLKEIDLEEDKELLLALQVAKAELDVTKENIAAEKALLEEKKLEVDALLDKAASLEEQESRIEREKTIDRERKALLDSREEKILAREARLAKIDKDSSLG